MRMSLQSLSLDDRAFAARVRATGLLAMLVFVGFSRSSATAPTPTMSALDKLVAIEEIHQLKARYFRCVDIKDWECWRTQLFAPDFVFDTHSKYGVVRGPEEMVELMRFNGLYDRIKTVHTGYMPEIEILSPTTARGIWAADFIHYYPLGQPYQTTGNEVAAPGRENHTYTFYAETYVKLNGKWFIRAMEIQSKPLRVDDKAKLQYPRLRPGNHGDKPSIFDRTEPHREVWPVLQGSELRFGVRIVILDMRRLRVLQISSSTSNAATGLERMLLPRSALTSHGTEETHHLSPTIGGLLCPPISIVTNSSGVAACQPRGGRAILPMRWAKMRSIYLHVQRIFGVVRGCNNGATSVRQVTCGSQLPL